MTYVIWLLARMQSHVRLKMVISSEAFVADIASIGFLTLRLKWNTEQNKWEISTSSFRSFQEMLSESVEFGQKIWKWIQYSKLFENFERLQLNLIFWNERIYIDRNIPVCVRSWFCRTCLYPKDRLHVWHVNDLSRVVAGSLLGVAWIEDDDGDWCSIEPIDCGDEPLNPDVGGLNGPGLTMPWRFTPLPPPTIGDVSKFEYGW